jgi:hypothetical protein
MALISRRKEEKMKHDFFFQKNYTPNTLFPLYKKERAEEKKIVGQPVADKNSKFYVEWLVVSGTATRLGEERKKNGDLDAVFNENLCAFLFPSSLHHRITIKSLFLHVDQVNSRSSINALAFGEAFFFVDDALDYIGLSLDTQKIKCYCKAASLFIDSFFCRWTSYPDELKGNRHGSRFIATCVENRYGLSS